jgi:transcriptional regulator with XRE-family HTH domain
MTSGIGPDLPLADMLRTARRRQCLTLQEVANRVNNAATADGRRGVATNRKRVSSWEGGEVPRPETLRWLARALDLDLEGLTRAADEQVTRREALRGGAMLGGALLLHDPGRLLTLMGSLRGLDADPMAGVPTVSRRLLEDLHSIAHHHGKQWGRVAPRSVLPAIRTNLALLRGWLPASMTPDLRRHLHLVTAETAWLAGWLCRQLDNRGDAAGYWACARDLARQVGEKPLLAHILVATSSLHSAVTGRSDGDAPTALALLDEAETVAGPRSSPALQSWVLARRAEEHASVGEAATAASEFDRAERLLDGCLAGDGLLADWDHERLTLWRAHCVVRPDAESPASAVAEAIRTLEKGLAGLAPSRVYDRSRALIELAEAHVTQRDVDQACAVLHASLTLTGDVGLVSHGQRVRRVRQRLAPWHDSSAVKLLDERLMLHP